VPNSPIRTIPGAPRSSTLKSRKNYNAATGSRAARTAIATSTARHLAPRPRSQPLDPSLQFWGGGQLVSRTNWQPVADARNRRHGSAGRHTHPGLVRVPHRPELRFLDEDFTIAPGVILPTGRDFSFTRYRAMGSTTSRRPLAVSSTLEWGDFYSGDRVGFDATVNLAPPWPDVHVHSQWNRVALAEAGSQHDCFGSLPKRSSTLGCRSPTTSSTRPESGSRLAITLSLDCHTRQRRLPRVHPQLLDDPLERRTYTLDRRLATKVM